MAHDYDKILTRLTIILNRLYEGEELSVSELAEEFNVTNKTIQRDFNERLYRFPIEKKGRKWKMMEGYKLEKKRSPDEEIVLDILENISDGIGSLFAQKTKSVLSKLKNIQESPVYAKVAIEDISDKMQEMKQIETAIQNAQAVTFQYRKEERKIHPYRIVNFEGYWYLLGVDTKDDRAKTYYLKDIFRIQPLEETFKKDTGLDSKMRGAINAWFEPDKEPFTIRLLAQQEIAKYFQRRPISPNQKLVQTHADGSIEIAFEITSFNEILPTIKYWMPNLHVIEPPALQQEVQKAAEAYLETSKTYYKDS